MLEDVDGFEFEELMMDVFRNLGYKNIRNPGKTGDEGRDIIMEKNVDGVETTFIVECKNLSSHVGRPVVQKLHSAVSTYETENRKQGMIVTTNRFSKAAREYAEKIDIQLWDGKKIREISNDIGLDLYNGKIEIVCDTTLPVPEKRRKIEEKVIDEFTDLRNFDRTVIEGIEIGLELVPALYIEAEVDSVYETSVGVINRTQTDDRLIWRGDITGEMDERKDLELEELISDSDVLDRIGSHKFSKEFDDITTRHFEKTETEFKEDIIEHQIQRHTEKVSYTGKNNVTYNKTHRPKKKDIRVKDILPIYVPKIKSETKIGDHTHSHHYFTDNNIEIQKRDDIHIDTRTRKEPVFFDLTLCQYCGTINNRLNIKTERLEKEPICRHCSTKKRFMFRQKHFKDKKNLRNFEKDYGRMPIHRKIMENKMGLTVFFTAASYITIFL